MGRSRSMSLLIECAATCLAVLALGSRIVGAQGCIEYGDYLHLGGSVDMHATDVVISGTYAYVAVGDTGLTVVDITDPRSPSTAGNTAPGFASAWPRRTNAYIAWRVRSSGDHWGSGPRIVGSMTLRARPMMWPSWSVRLHGGVSFQWVAPARDRCHRSAVQSVWAAWICRDRHGVAALAPAHVAAWTPDSWARSLTSEAEDRAPGYPAGLWISHPAYVADGDAGFG
jgi:hypothetical protein